MKSREYIFTSLFINDIQALFEVASYQAGEEDGLLFQEEVDILLNYLWNLKIHTRADNLQNLFHLLEELQKNFHAKKITSHPFLDALRVTKTKLLDFIALTEIATITLSPSVKTIPITPSVLKESKREPRPSGPERLFPDFFVEKIESIFTRFSAQSGLSAFGTKIRVLNPKQTAQLIHAIKNLMIDQHGTVIEQVSLSPLPTESKEEMKDPLLGKNTITTHPFLQLLELIDKTKATYCANHKNLGSTLPFASALDNVKKLLNDFFSLTATSTRNKINSFVQETEAEIKSTRSNRAVLAAKIVPYALICPLVSLFTCNNTCREKSPNPDCHCCGPEDLHNGETACNDPISSIKSISEAYSAESNRSDMLLASAPMRQKMK